MTKRACQPFEEQLAAYADGGLEGRELEQVEDHLAACPACRDEAVALARLLADVHDAAAPRTVRDERFWQDFSRQVSAAVAATPPGLGARLLAWLRKPVVVGGFCAVAAALLMVVYVQRPPERHAVVAAPVGPVVAPVAPVAPHPVAPVAPVAKAAPVLPATDGEIDDLDATQLHAVLNSFDRDDEVGGNDDESLALRDGNAATAEAVDNLSDDELARVYAAL